MSDFLTETLPRSWLLATIADIAEVNPKIDKSDIADDTAVSFVPMPAVQAETGIVDVSQTRCFGDVKKGYTPFQEGDILFAKITPCMENGKMVVAPALKNGFGFGSTEFHILRPFEGMNAKYLYFFISSQAFRHEAEHNMTGAVGQRRVPTAYLLNQTIPFPPPREQHCIVAKIEELFSELDKGIEALTTARQQLKAYRQSIIKAVLSGALTGSDANGWQDYTVGQLVTDVRYGTAKKCSVDPSKTPVLRIPNIVGWHIDLSDLKHTDFELGELEKLRLEAGDVLLVRSNGSVSLVGLPAVVTDKAVGYAYAGYLIRLRLKKEIILPEFLNLCLRSPVIRIDIERQARSTSGVHNINSDEIRAISVKVPPIDQQRKILAVLTEKLSHTDASEACIMTELQRSAVLRQSILKNAFSGHLVAQNVTDEPASVLLARIRAEREKSEPKKKRNGKTEKKNAA
jgi:type I restriction enzyme S subunit